MEINKLRQKLHKQKNAKPEWDAKEKPKTGFIITEHGFRFAAITPLNDELSWADWQVDLEYSSKRGEIVPNWAIKDSIEDLEKWIVSAAGVGFESKYNTLIIPNRFLPSVVSFRTITEFFQSGIKLAYPTLEEYFDAMRKGTPEYNQVWNIEQYETKQS